MTICEFSWLDSIIYVYTFIICYGIILLDYIWTCRTMYICRGRLGAPRLR